MIAKPPTPIAETHPVDLLTRAETQRHVEFLKAVAAGDAKQIRRARQRWVDAAAARELAERIVRGEA